MKQYLRFGAIAACVLGLGSIGVISATSASRTDRLPDSNWWQSKVRNQVNLVRDRQFAGCLFGDSISSGLGNSFGTSTFNFAMGGLSSVSLLEQLRLLKRANLQCQSVIIAIGTNDAMYSINNNEFTRNLERIIELSRSIGATRITMLPAFYSTVEASYNPNAAGTLDRVDEISGLIRQVAAEKGVEIVDSELQSFWRDRSLKQELTVDGVHLNENGKKIYRQLIVGIFDSKLGSR